MSLDEEQAPPKLESNMKVLNQTQLTGEARHRGSVNERTAVIGAATNLDYDASQRVGIGYEDSADINSNIKEGPFGIKVGPNMGTQRLQLKEEDY